MVHVVECRVQSYRYPKSDREKDHFTHARVKKRPSESGQVQPRRSPEITLLCNPITYFLSVLVEKIIISSL